MAPICLNTNDISGMDHAQQHIEITGLESNRDIDIACMQSKDQLHKPQETYIPKSKRSVSFNPTTLIYDSEPLSMEEIQAGWYSESEMFTLRGTVRNEIRYVQTIGLIRAGIHHDDDDKFCVRGLERRIRNYESKLRRVNIISSINAVLLEQELQKSRRGRCNPDTIAYVYVKECFACQAAATEIGRQDEIVAQQLWPWEEL